MEQSRQSGPAARLIRPMIIIFFSVYLLLGLLLARDYGVTWDDDYERLHGLVVMDYFNDLSGGKLFDRPFSQYKLEDYFNRHYGTAFQTAAMTIEIIFGLDDPREWYFLRHYMTFLVWFIALVFFYKLLQERFRNPAFSLIGVIFMILSPRIFADAFYNSKDVIFLAFYIISTYTLVRFLHKPGIRSAFYLALASALLINTRILGIIIPAISLSFILLRAIRDHKSKTLAKYYLIHTTSYILFLFALTILLWPYLWESPFVRLIESFRTMGHFPWDDPVLYWGKFIPATDLPFHYVLSWIMITTPLLYVFLFIVGATIALFRGIKIPQGKENEIDLLNLSLFFLPLLVVIILRSTLYDGWRQMFFLYGPFLMLAMTGFHELLKLAKRPRPFIVSRWMRMLIFLAIAYSLATVTFFMVKYHPHQNVYFNFIAGKETTKNFEADYWGLSYRQALEYILEHDDRDSIPVFAVNWPGRANAGILPGDQRNRLMFVEPGQADYWLSNYRFPGEHGRYFRREPPYDKVFWEKKVRGNAIVGVYIE